MSLFLEPAAHQALVRKAHAERTQFIVSCLRRFALRVRRAPAAQRRRAANLLEKIRAVLEQYWALPLSRS